MTEVERKALVQAVAAAGRRMQDYNIMAEENPLRQSIEAHARAIEQHEAFRKEVSDVLEAALSVFNQLVLDERGEIALRSARLVFARFIIPKPDPVSQIANDFCLDAECLAQALAKRGLQVTEIER